MSNWLKQAGLVAASLLFSLVLIEAMLRLLGWSFPLFAQPDRDLGWSFRPHVSGWSTHENTAHVRMNRYGFRGPDWPERPDGKTIRIAMLGDSFLDSTNLSEDEALNRVVEKEIASCPALAGRRVEVLNFGVSGYGTGQQFLQLQQKVAGFQPQLVLVGYYAGNDVMNNSQALSVEGQKTKPYFLEKPDGALQLDTSFRDSEAFRNEVRSDWQRRLVNSSYLLQALKQVTRGKTMVPAPLEFSTAVDGKLRGRYRPEAIGLYAPPGDETWRSAWSVTEKTFLQMRDWSRQRQLGFGLVIIPDPVQALPGQAERDSNAKAIGAADLDYPVSRLAQFATQNGMPTLSLLEPFREHGDRERVFLYGFPPKLGSGHLNGTGNALGGKLIADWVCSRFLVPAQSSSKAPL
ncbi:SGNH/GDSL hydrolase family protein [Pseudorhodoplanes sp.]|uniref:SGNH/GDSL hydrolase family protein n=1 Tax=Pseudorhodoplanes sp. TaxID=1934341 RepID=UPI003D0D2D01